MNFTFGIITNGSDLINSVINSIYNLQILDYEIIIVGSNIELRDKNIIYIPYTDKSSQGDISTKKNIITKNAKYDNIVYLHDYIAFDYKWYNKFLEFKDDFDICMTKIINYDGTRYRDWCLWGDDANGYVHKNHYLIPYNITHLSKMMYISGAYWVGKKDFMLNNLLNEKLKWGQGEDVEWSLRVRQKTNFKINQNSVVHLLKYKDRIFAETTHEENTKLKSLINYDDSNSYDNLIKNHIGHWM